MAEQPAVGRVTKIDVRRDQVEITAPPARVRVVFLTDDVVRIWMAPNGHFTDPANTKPPADEPDANIVVKADYPGVEPELADEGELLPAQHPDPDAADPQGSAHVRVVAPARRRGRHPHRRGDTVPHLERRRRLAQYLSRGADEQFFGAGMQNGALLPPGDDRRRRRSSYNWNDGGCPNSVPFYLSTRRLRRVPQHLRARLLPFTDPVRPRHEEHRFDAYYFVGAAEARDRPLHGADRAARSCRPSTAWRWATPTAICYNAEPGRAPHPRRRGGGRRLRGADDMPLGWMLVNDGYGCGYEDLDQVVQGLAASATCTLGLWTSTGLARPGAGGPGRRPGPQARRRLGRPRLPLRPRRLRGGVPRASRTTATAAASCGRRWAGPARSATPCSGAATRTGSWEYIRWQIPTYAGATMSGLAYTTGDVDGIFGGSAETYTRDLQWKSFLPVVMTMDGWAEYRQAALAPRRAVHVDQPQLHPAPGAAPALLLHLRRRGAPAPASEWCGRWRSSTPTTRRPCGTRSKLPVPGRRRLPRRPRLHRHRGPGRHLPARRARWTDYWTGERHQGPIRLNPTARRWNPPAVRQGRVDRADVAGGNAVVGDPRPQPARPRHLPRRRQRSSPSTRTTA